MLHPSRFSNVKVEWAAVGWLNWTGPYIREAERTSTFQVSESGGSLNGPDLFAELLFLYKSLPIPSFTECLPRFHHQKTLCFPLKKCFVSCPSETSKSACAPLCCKNMCCASRFCMGGRGAACSKIQANVQGLEKPNASPGEQSEAPRRRWMQGQKQHPGPQDQDSQHMLNQPRGPFSDERLCEASEGVKLRSVSG